MDTYDYIRTKLDIREFRRKPVPTEGDSVPGFFRRSVDSVMTGTLGRVGVE